VDDCGLLQTASGVDNLLARIEGMTFRLRPHFVTLTWRSAFTDELLWLRIGAQAQRDFGIDVLMHLTCHLPVTDLRRILKRCREAGIRNILALRGDPPIGSDKWIPCEGGLRNAVELVRLIREEHGDFFCVAVAGYPETHTECWNHPELPPSEQSRRLDMLRLKEKVDAGADFVITQFFYDVPAYFAFEREYTSLGITAPLLPGYMPIQNYPGFAKFTKWCKTSVPRELWAAAEAVKDDDDAVKDLGVREAVRVCKLLMSEGCKSLHFYTMNLSHSVSQVLDALGLLPRANEREMPWSTSAREKEAVRPIFWAHRAASYIARTSEWDEYPNGRWGDQRSPAYGELTDYYLASKRPTIDRVKLWGAPQTVSDIQRVFAQFVQGKVPQLPWCESALSEEASVIQEELVWLNKHGFLTINSQPAVNGAPSSHEKFGWGGPDGFVFQKAYVEFFVSPELWSLLHEAFARYPSLSFHAMNLKGDEFINTDRERAMAVTWGVFPGREIIQPTVVDPVSFRTWRDEAFELWRSQWASAYREDHPLEKASKDLVESIRASWFLVNVVDNAYAEEDSDIFAIFHDVATESMSTEALRLSLGESDAESRSLRLAVADLRMKVAHLESDLVFQTDRATRAEAQVAALQKRLAELGSRSSSTSASTVSARAGRDGTMFIPSPGSKP
jgi:methylenetetrahydrofolate reductase (NADPH)